MGDLFETRSERLAAMRRRADQPEIEGRVDNLRMRRAPRVVLSPNGVAAFAEARRQAMIQNLEALPSVEEGLAAAARREELSRLRAVVAGAYVDDLPSVAETLATVDRVRSTLTPSREARLASLRRQVKGDQRLRQRVPRGTSAATAAKIRRAGRKPVSAAARARADEQRVLIAAMKAGAYGGSLDRLVEAGVLVRGRDGSYSNERLVASGALAGAGDLTRPWNGLRRIGTRGYHT